MDEWKKRVLTYHIAELYADMLAEYIAAGTALAMVAFYWDHPKYQLRKATAEGLESSLTQNGLSSRQVSLFTLLIVVEIFVDYVSCVITIRHGIRFDSITKYAAFITAAFVSLAALNMQISALMYLDITG
ncbi:hypothetical protein Poli38472_010139 [Pythium oligandrum]|uniref:Uncharacterized protein n=1 Tax=Pythium oligandrum TaxID=41045 RepID=A0A8K1C959_PYTOL|nr:hypothetical protein Poli38472_010139 [Pythium oligandrum]|eukprot:TMW58580.1 hypothetical protein Poli38472_010139 [Pythium oligandrum]